MSRAEASGDMVIIRGKVRTISRMKCNVRTAVQYLRQAEGLVLRPKLTVLSRRWWPGESGNEQKRLLVVGDNIIGY